MRYEGDTINGVLLSIRSINKVTELLITPLSSRISYPKRAFLTDMQHIFKQKFSPNLKFNFVIIPSQASNFPIQFGSVV